VVSAVTFAPGVNRRDESGHAVYTGRADALVAAGLVEQHQLPGQAGNGRGIVLVEGDATTPKKRIVACVRDGEPKLEVWQTLQHWPFPVIGDTFMGGPIPEPTSEEPKQAPRRQRSRKSPDEPSPDLSDEQRFFVAQVPSVLRALRERVTTRRMPKVEIDLNAMRVCVAGMAL
jgi:hypothetical protein